MARNAGLGFAEFDPGAVLCAGIALVAALSLVIRAAVETGRQRSFAVTALAQESDERAVRRSGD